MTTEPPIYVLPLVQPFASLLAWAHKAVGDPTYQSRLMPPIPRGSHIVIHARAKWGEQERAALLHPDVVTTLRALGYTRSAKGSMSGPRLRASTTPSAWRAGALPLGALLGVATFDHLTRNAADWWLWHFIDFRPFAVSIPFRAEPDALAELTDPALSRVRAALNGE